MSIVARLLAIAKRKSNNQIVTKPITITIRTDVYQGGMMPDQYGLIPATEAADKTDKYDALDSDAQKKRIALEIMAAVARGVDAVWVKDTPPGETIDWLIEAGYLVEQGEDLFWIEWYKH